MKRLIASIFLVLTLFLVTRAACAQDITIVADEWCPYNCATTDVDPGIFIEVAKRIFEPLGYRVVYQTMPWSRAIEDTRSGKFSAVVGALHEEVPDFIFPIFPTIESKSGFYTAIENPWIYKDVKSLEGISLGVIQDYVYSNELNTYIKDNHDSFQRIQSVGGDDALSKNVQKLLHGRIDALVEDQAVMSYYVKQNNLVGRFRLAGSTGKDGLFIAFSPSNKDESRKLAKIFDEGLSRLRRAGILGEILAKYGVDNQ